MLRCVPADSLSSTMWILIHQVFQVFDDDTKLDKVVAAFYEGLRMFRKLDVKILSFLVPKLFISQMAIASGHILVREAAEDTVLEIPKPHSKWVLPVQVS